MNEYWRRREEQAQREYRLTEDQYVAAIDDVCSYMLDMTKKEVNEFYSKYMSAENITYAEAVKRVTELDIEEYERKAKKYVAEKDFSAQANREMKLYNLTMKVNRLTLLEANIGLETVSGFDELSKLMGQDLNERVLQEIARQSGILGMTMATNDISRAADVIVNASFHNATFSERIWMYQAQLRDELDKALREGLIQGRNPNELARHIDNLFDTGRYNAERLLRTELARVQTEAQKQSFIANGFDEYQFNALGDACPVCRALDEKHFKIVDMQVGENASPLHPNCVTADTEIMAPDAEAIMRSWYSGDIVEIRTANGTRLSVTPNHIVLTARGWVRAKNLVKGDKVVHYRGNVSDSVHAEPADDDSSPTIEDLFTAVVEASDGSTLSMPATTVDLKGDAVPDSEIDIIGVDSKLRDKLDATVGKLISDSPLIGTGKLGERELPFKSTLATLLIGIGLAADGIMSGLRVSEVLLRGALGHGELIGLRLGSDYDARLQKTAVNNGTADPKLLSNSIFADAGFVESGNLGDIEIMPKTFKGTAGLLDGSLDSGTMETESLGNIPSGQSAIVEGDDFSDVFAFADAGRLDTVSVQGVGNDAVVDTVNISDVADCFSTFVEFDDIELVSIRKNFVGHVYDTSCISTLYISNGIITSNCRCSTSAWMDDALYQQWLKTYANHEMSYEDWLMNREFTSGQSSSIIISGAVSGALNPYSDEAQRHAEQYYESVRHMKTDVARIAKNTGWEQDKIKSIKSYVFVEEHELWDGTSRFTPSYDMAQSWQRLIDGKNIKEQDLVLLDHEYLELSLVAEGMTQDDAHIEASRKYNYAKYLE